ncbi:MAG: hypothetical protein QG640_3 [Patescibacteria group bacterium]|nr:hypothetical protein [Patescibacteria group bacterium]
MISNIQKLKIARELRLGGKSLGEISHETNIPRSTLSYWLRDIVLNEKQRIELKNRVKPKMGRGRLNAVISLRSNRIFKENKAFEEAKREFIHLRKDPVFIFGLTLYLSHGTKKGSSFQFSSSDSTTISLMKSWIKKYLKVEDVLIKQRNYGSHKRIDIMRIDVLRKVIAWQKQLIQYYGTVLNV